MLKLSEIGLYEQCFTHIHEGTVTMLAVERLQKSEEYLALEIVVTPVEKHFADWCRENRGVEQRRLERLSLIDLVTSPLTYCEFPKDGQTVHLLVDGNHRYVKASMLGMMALPGRVVPEAIWRKFQVGDIPMEVAEFFVANDSGIP